MDKCGVLVTVPISSPELLATLPLTGRGNECQGCSEAPSLSSILTSDDTTQHSCSPDSNLSANQALPAPPPILFHSLPSTTQTGLPDRPWVIDLTRSTWSLQGHALVPWESRIPSSEQLEFADHQGRDETCSDCSRAKKPWVRAKCFQSQAPVCVWEEVAKATRVLTPQDCSPVFSSGGATLSQG